MEVASKVTKAAYTRLDIAEMYLKGKYQSEIATELGISQAAISKNLKAIREEWLKSTLINFNEAVAKELAKVDNLERVYWESWERSLKNFKSKTTKTPTKLGTQKTTKVEERVGSVQFLQGVQWCIEKRCKLLGLDAPERLQIDWRETLPDGIEPHDVTEQFSELMKLASNATNDQP